MAVKNVPEKEVGNADLENPVPIEKEEAAENSSCLTRMMYVICGILILAIIGLSICYCLIKRDAYVKKANFKCSANHEFLLSKVAPLGTGDLVRVLFFMNPNCCPECKKKANENSQNQPPPGPAPQGPKPAPLGQKPPLDPNSALTRQNAALPGTAPPRHDPFSDWTEHKDKQSGDTYWYNSKTKESRWKFPLPPGWKAYRDPDQNDKLFYENEFFGQVVWEANRTKIWSY